MQRQSELLVEYQTRNEEELNDAQEFMGRLLALDKLTDPLVQFHMQAAEVFSGDLIAAGRTPAGHLCVMLADSTGHGLTAALAVMPVLQSFHAMVAKGYSIGAVAAEINRKIMEYLPANRFVAAVLISLDAHNGRVSVWNGGCPPAVLLNPDGMVACQFDSKHLPLGILNPNYFDDEVMHYHYGNNRCHLLLCSDGAVDVADPVSMEIGMAQLVRAACTENMAERLPGIVNMLEEKMAGKKALDDIALILIDCQAEDLAEIAASQQPEAEIIKPDSKCISLEAGLQNSEMSLEWEFSLTLTAPQLKQADIVPLLLHIVNQIELDTPSLAGSLFLVLSELFNNALDHGLLRLDSALKHDPQGMDRYFEERTTRLKQLELGEIKIALTKISTQSGPCLKIAVRDTGDGFDVATLQANALDASTRRHGRGIALVKSLCNQLTYSDHGRESQALICIG
jgi:anti-sigma regulatory factor (Ser/Thr protein kinase)